jgi:hypothetical protein
MSKYRRLLNALELVGLQSLVLGSLTVIDTFVLLYVV